MLPYLEMQAVYDLLGLDGSTLDDTANHHQGFTVIPAYICPSWPYKSSYTASETYYAAAVGAITVISRRWRRFSDGRADREIHRFRQSSQQRDVRPRPVA